MAPARTEEPISWSTETVNERSILKGRPRNIDPIDAIKFDENLQPKHYNIIGTHEDSKILFTDVKILDSTGAEPYHGDVLIEGEPEVSIRKDVNLVLILSRRVDHRCWRSPKCRIVED